jgi:nucleoside triphosphate pyrophosphatase
MRFVLASASPRRRDLLTQAGYDFEVVPSSVDEESITANRPEALARRIAQTKAEDVAMLRPGKVVLAADTIVVLRGEVLGKPRDAREARQMLGRLRDRRHRVITAVCVIAPGKRTQVDHVVTRVAMRPYAQDEVEAFIASGSPFDKAGGYAVQDADFAPVAAFDGCYCNVLGLPLWTAIRLLREAGIEAAGANGPTLPPVCADCVTKDAGPDAPLLPQAL